MALRVLLLVSGWSSLATLWIFIYLFCHHHCELIIIINGKNGGAAPPSDDDDCNSCDYCQNDMMLCDPVSVINN